MDINDEFARIRLMFEGKQSIIADHKFESKLLQNQWYRVEILMRRGFLDVKFDKHDPKSDVLASAPIIFSGDDSSLKSGSFGLTMDNVKQGYFSEISVDPLDCEQDEYDET